MTAAQGMSGDSFAVEIDRFEAAAHNARRELRTLSSQLEREYGRTEGRILHAQFFMLDDPLLRDAVRRHLARGTMAAETAVAAAIDELESRFRESTDAYIRERALDVHDIGVRLLRHLADRTHHPLAQLPDDVVVLAEELLPSDTIFLDRTKVRAVVTERGTDNSHAAILARALGVPAVTQVPGILGSCTDGDPISVDGESGRVIVHIEGQAQDDYVRQARIYQSASDEIHKEPYAETVTHDGVRISLMANISSLDDAEAASRYGAAGVGLFRTDFLYTVERGVTPEEEQAAVYRRVAELMGERPVTIRTLDCAPDKQVPLSTELPLAGATVRQRGIRYALRHVELLRPQLRAILRASRCGNVRILLPGVTEVAEIRQIHGLIEELSAELRATGEDVSRQPPVGAMVETVPALLMVADIVRATDFVCVGSNDLLAHLFGRVRQHTEAVDVESVFEPSLLRAIASVVHAALAGGKEVSLCGEIAGAPTLTALLVGLGLRVLSMSPERLAEVRYNVREMNAASAKRLAARALKLGSAAEVEALVLADQSPWRRLLDRRSRPE